MRVRLLLGAPFVRRSSAGRSRKSYAVESRGELTRWDRAPVANRSRPQGQGIVPSTLRQFRGHGDACASAPFVYWLGSCSFKARKAGRNRHGAPITPKPDVHASRGYSSEAEPRSSKPSVAGSIPAASSKHSGVAQSAARPTLNRQVEGSSPSARAILLRAAFAGFPFAPLRSRTPSEALAGRAGTG